MLAHYLMIVCAYFSIKLINVESKIEEALKTISPYFFAHKISSPVMMYHFKDDEIIEYAQGEAYAKKLKELGKDVRFISGKGEHGFTSDLAEENQYKKIVKFFNTKLNANYENENK